MPTPPKSLENTTKHWTTRELDARDRAERGLKRSTRVTLRTPAWLSDTAREVWDDVRRKLHHIELLDNLDTELLAIYCDAVAHYREISIRIHADDVLDDDLVKQAQAWARLISSYAEKLGLSPNSRARLAKKKAERELPDELTQLLDEVSDFVNRGNE